MSQISQTTEFPPASQTISPSFNGNVAAHGNAPMVEMQEPPKVESTAQGDVQMMEAKGQIMTPGEINAEAIEKAAELKKQVKWDLKIFFNN